MFLPESFGSLQVSARPKLDPGPIRQPFPWPPGAGRFPALAPPSTADLQSPEIAYGPVVPGSRFE
jgi:hypothetical protein